MCLISYGAERILDSVGYIFPELIETLQMHSYVASLVSHLKRMHVQLDANLPADIV